MFQNILLLAILYTLIGVSFRSIRQREIHLLGSTSFFGPIFLWPIWAFWTRRGHEALLLNHMERLGLLDDEEGEDEEDEEFEEEEEPDPDDLAVGLLTATMGVTADDVVQRMVRREMKAIVTENLETFLEMQADEAEAEDSAKRPNTILMTEEIRDWLNWNVGWVVTEGLVDTSVCGFKVRVVEEDEIDGAFELVYEGDEEEVEEDFEVFEYADEDIMYYQNGGYGELENLGEPVRTREELTQRMIAWFENKARSDGYDAYAVTDLSVKPEDWHGDFIRVPFPAENKAFWGFRSLAEADAFEANIEGAKGVSLDDITRLHTL